ncbi:MAG: acyl-CoA thioesterase [Bacteroidetes bacterium]|nr:acyl-CoA thioesterase [Bacteroidota bacterium]
MSNLIHTPPILRATSSIEVRFNECDPLGIVWHGNYVKYLEDGREAFGKKYGLDYMDFYINGYATPIVHLQLDFKKTMQYKEIAQVEVTYRNTEAAKIIFDYVIRSETKNEIVCKATTTQVFVSNGSMQLSLVCPDIFTKWKQNNGV